MAEQPFEAFKLQQLTEQQREQLTQNILAAQLLTEELTASTVEHLGATHNACPKACIGRLAMNTIGTMTQEALIMTLTMAVRELAEARYEFQHGEQS